MSRFDPRPEIGIVCPLSDPTWDQDVAALPKNNFFHRRAWAAVLADTYGYQPLYFVLRRRGRVAGALPVMEIKSWLTGHRGISLPFTDGCEPLCESQADFDDLLNAALRHGAEQRWRYVELRGGRRWFGGASASTEFYRHRLELADDEGAMFQRLEPAVRRACRKADRAGLTIEFSDSLEATREFYALLQMTRQRHGVPTQPFRFFAKIQEHVLAKHHGTLVLARFERRPVAGAIFFHAGNTVHYKFGGSDLGFQELRANNLVMWQAIKWAAARGFRELDFGRTSADNHGLRRFKAGWGAVEVALEYFRRLVPNGEFLSAHDRSDGWHTHFLRYAPAFFSRALGHVLYRHVA